MDICIDDGMIYESIECMDDSRAYKIDEITAEFDEDNPEVIGIVRCTAITIESDAPDELNREAELALLNQLADIEFYDADGDGTYRQEAAEEISQLTGVNIDQIDIV